MDNVAMMEPVARPLHYSAKEFKSSNGTLSDDLRKLVTKLLIKNSEQHRDAIIITTVFSVVAALLVIYSILRDAFKVQDGEAYSPAQRRRGFLRILNPAEVFPFTVAVGNVLQGLIFIGVQAAGLKGFWASRCRLTSELVWPAVWIVPLVILVLSLEVTFRSLLRKRFRARGNWDTPVCIAIVALLLLALWMTAFFMPALDMCPGSLIWWTVHYSRLGMVFGPGIIFTHFISAVILGTQLWRTIQMDRDERIAASRVVYSLGVSTFMLVLLLPFWIERLTEDFMGHTSKVADIALTLNGLAQSALYVFLRGNADRLAIRPREAAWASKRGLRLFGPNDLNVGMFISTPLLKQPQEPKDFPEWKNDKSQMKYPPRQISNSTDPRRAHSPMQLSAAEPTLPTSKFVDPCVPKPLKVAQPEYAQKRSKSSYSIFPTAASARRPALTSWLSNKSSADDEPLPLPAPLFGRQHSRNESTKSSATIEIGMRLSSMQDVQVQQQHLRRPSMSVSVPRPPQDLDCKEGVVPMAPAMQQRESVSTQPRASSILTADWPGMEQFTMMQPTSNSSKPQMMKSLPPTPPTESQRSSKMPPPPPLTLSSRSYNKNSIAVSPQPAGVSPSAGSIRSADFHSPGYSPPPQPSPWPLPTKPIQAAETWI